MQPIITSNIKEQITTTIQKKSYGQSHTSTKSTANGHKENTANHPEDNIDLSRTLTFTQIASENKKTSTPVTNEERTALLDSFPDKKSFSIYF